MYYILKISTLPTKNKFNCASNNNAETMFIDSFKYYKSRNPLPNFENIIDVKDTIEECVSTFLN